MYIQMNGLPSDSVGFWKLGVIELILVLDIPILILVCHKVPIIYDGVSVHEVYWLCGPQDRRLNSPIVPART